MTLIKTSLLNAVAVATRMLTLLGLNKIFAIYVGPAGYAMIGQLQNTIAMAMTLSGGAINTGVTKYTAEYHESEDQQHKVWQTALKISLICTLTISTLSIVFNRWLAENVLGDAENGNIFIWFSATLFLFVLNSLLLAIINGKKEVYLYVKINISGSLLGLVISGLLAYFYGLYGALIASVTNQSIVFFLTLWLCRHQTWLRWHYFWGTIDKESAKNLSKYILMALTSAITVPVTHILIRSHLVDQFGWEGAGYWDGIWRISSIYLMFVTTTLSIYYLPRLSEITGKSELREEVKSGYKVILPATILLSISIYLSRDLIISILFTNDFLAMSNLFAWQLAGDVVKISSWLLGYILAAKALVKIFIFSELVFSGSFYALVLLLTDRFGLESAVLAYFINYILHFIFIFWVLRKKRVI